MANAIPAQAGGEAAFSNSAAATRIDLWNSLGEINLSYNKPLTRMSSGSMKISSLKLSSLPRGEAFSFSGTGVTPVISRASPLSSASSRLLPGDLRSRYYDWLCQGRTGDQLRQVPLPGIQPPCAGESKSQRHHQIPCGKRTAIRL